MVAVFYPKQADIPLRYVRYPNAKATVAIGTK